MTDTAMQDQHSEAFVLAHDAPVEALEPGIKRQILSYSPDLMLCRLWFEAGVSGTVHQHPHSQITYIESGRFRSMMGGREKELAAGDSVMITPDTDHGITCMEAGSLLDIFNPVREDFLEGGGYNAEG
ncbi:Cupin domain-containing protein [Parasphingorhabdus marina DSM 22363]|uniref:Cupin domain-containing protein n=1 Tax=Parasphingorhabdus marina DSM 22363 TaxID=1123272 RepID=A0A1N6EH80_9SPHN|nr:cupin domain-containing protein [Parasphingorhabdus marina]SIN82394.1 Cupin domain-containing protein [Parasphingorhabdus marina DSM 22363]